MGSTSEFGSKQFVLDLCHMCDHHDFSLYIYIHDIINKNDAFSAVVKNALMEIFMSRYEIQWLSNTLDEVEFHRICRILIQKIDDFGMKEAIPPLYKEFEEYYDLYENVLSKKDH